jgi:hypothetical protein
LLARKDALDRAHTIAFVDRRPITAPSPDDHIPAPLVTGRDRVVAAASIKPISSPAADHPIAPAAAVDPIHAGAVADDVVAGERAAGCR